MKPLRLLLLSLLIASPVVADVSLGSALVRDGKPAEAIDELRGIDSPDAAFWRGRAMIALGRTGEAAAELHKVPEQHELFPYAAKALLYCAWHNKDIDFAVTATPMATCSHEEIATLATAALAEHWLHQPHSQDNTALTRLRNLAEKQPSLRPLLRLLEIDNLRLRGEYDKAVELCKELEADRELPLITRQRVRLALSDVYYAKEAAEKKSGQHKDTEKKSGLPLLNTDTQQNTAAYDDGKGEETLLHFISSHPDSPLLEEAFRRLYKRNAFTNSEFARVKLREWMAEPLKSRRAAWALLIQQHLLNPEKAYDMPLDVTCANTAAATCPHEPATRLLLLEQTRWFLERRQTHEALLYLGMIEGDDVYRRFYENQLHAPEADSTAQTYLNCARDAAGDLRHFSLINALISALKSGDKATEEAVLQNPDITQEQQYTLLLTRAGYWLDKDAGKAQADLDRLLAMDAPTPDLLADAEMDKAYLNLKQNPQSALDFLRESKINDSLTRLSAERQLRFFALQEEALRLIAGPDNETEAITKSIQLIKHAAGKVNKPKVVSVLTVHLASLQSSLGLHNDSLRTLEVLLRKYPKGDFGARALYMSARESEFIGTHHSLVRAAELYETCANRSDELATKSMIRRAAVLLRLGNHEESEHILTGLLQNKRDKMRDVEIAMAKGVLANNKAMLGTAEGRNEAIEIISHALGELKLPRAWRFRGLLHHATLCARAEQHEQALRDYEEVLNMKPASGASPDKAEWHILYSAGSGIIMQLLYLERFTEAAEKADLIANWNAEHANPDKSKQYSDWAEFIRQTNFVDKNQLPF